LGVGVRPSVVRGKTVATFRALLVEGSRESGWSGCRLTELSEADLMKGDVTVRVTHSTVNYKDALAVRGRSPIVRRFPLVPGVDLAGVVENSSDSDLPPGTEVLLNGWGVGETHHGGLAERASVSRDWLLPLPPGMTPGGAMAVGTAGYTAALSVLALERHGLTPDRGPALVTGAAGGVGSFAVALLARAGWQVIASTGRRAEEPYLRQLGAASVIDRAELSAPARPLSSVRWAAAVDVVGSHTLANVLSMTSEGGAVAACGLVQGIDLPASVAPFILRGVALLGVESVRAPLALRKAAWDRIAADLRPEALALMTAETIGLDRVFDAADRVLAGKVRGRVVVDMSA
jgi:acrylyl-CoA reductase (NADPH)